MSPYEQIKAEVIKCCPEIMELKMGCEVNSEKWNYKKVKYIRSTGLLDFYLISNEYEQGHFSRNRDDEFEILGSPIELHHILRTISIPDIVPDICIYRKSGFITIGEHCHYNQALADLQTKIK